jgi:hypothetical protein
MQRNNSYIASQDTESEYFDETTFIFNKLLNSRVINTDYFKTPKPTIQRLLSMSNSPSQKSFQSFIKQAIDIPQVIIQIPKAFSKSL